MISSNGNNNLSQNLFKLKKAINLTLFKKLKNQPKLFKSKILVNFTTATNTGIISYQTIEANIAIIHLRQIFIKALIVQHFDLECHIRIKINVSGYAITRVLS